MATYGKSLLDINGNVILPKTRSILVYMSDNTTLEETINRIKSGEQMIGFAKTFRIYNTATSSSISASFGSVDSNGLKAFLWDETNRKTMTVDNALDQSARDTANSAKSTAEAAMPKSGGRFSGEVWAVARNSQTDCLRDIGIYNPGGAGYANSYKLVCIRE